MGVTLDTGALIAIERGDVRMRERLRAMHARGELATIPAAVICEAWRDSSRQVELARLIERSDVENVGAALAKRGGELLSRTGTADAVDAIVACSAARRGDVVLTSDPDDLQRLADDLGTIRVQAI